MTEPSGQHRMARFVLLVGAISAVSCALGISFDTYDVAPGGRYHVGGNVHGLEGQRVVLDLEGSEHEVGDGAFIHPFALPDGGHYALKVTHIPPSIACEVVRGTGTIVRNDIADVEISCTSNDASLRRLEVSGAQLSPSFVSSGTSYRARFDGRFISAQRRAKIVVAPTNPLAEVSIAGAPLDPDQPSRTFSLQPGANDVTIDVRAPDRKAQRRYLVTIELPNQSQRLADSTTFGFGSSVAVAADVLGAVHAGQVSVWTRPASGAWQKSATLSPPGNTDAYNSTVLAITSDRIVVGTPNQQSGRVHVYRRNATDWVLEATLVSPSSEALFGSAVAISGDVVVVGQPLAGSSRAHVFRRTTIGWVFHQTLTARVPDRLDGFGCSVAIEGDDVAVGANLDSSTAPSAGAAFLFTREADTWTDRAYLKPSNTRASSRFGSAVSLHSGVLAVGAPGDSTPSVGIDGVISELAGSARGAVYVFERDGSTWVQTAFMKPLQTAAETAFGRDVSLHDGLLAIASPEETQPGVVYLAGKSGAHWYYWSRLPGPVIPPSDDRSGSVRLTSDTLILAAPSDTTGGGYSGAVLAY